MASSSSGSGLTFKLHPLVIVNISDHHTRVRAQIQHSASAAPLAEGGSGRVFGCVIGIQRGRTVEIFNSFELLYDPLTHSLDRSFLEKKQELYKKVFPNFYILGWYSTGSEAQESDLQIHKAVSFALPLEMFLFEDMVIILSLQMLYSDVTCFMEQLMDINESPVYVLLNPLINHAQKDLPVTIYESGT
ncbi:hypothetical protein BHE74_00011106 [Ensete ventricosum]|nr:hypothetical protein BHE74_00011106 [Ensete ventricosum]